MLRAILPKLRNTDIMLLNNYKLFLRKILLYIQVECAMTPIND